MFTGIIAEVGSVERLDRDGGGARLRVRATLAGELERGDSVAVNGACLTAAARDGEAFEADVTNRTLERTSLGPLRAGDAVNLELALRASDRIGGHLVQGHVDGTGVLAAVVVDGIARRLEVALAPEMRRYVVERGSVALDGVSLTVTALTEGGFEVSLIPETLDRTTLGAAVEGRVVNVELDVIARYAERFMAGFGA